MEQREKMEYLKRYRVAGAAERRLREELAMWRSTAEKATAALSAMPRGQGNGPGRLEQAVEHLAELETALEAALEEREMCIRDSCNSPRGTPAPSFWGSCWRTSSPRPG